MSTSANPSPLRLPTPAPDYRYILDQASDAIFVTDDRGIVADVNARTCELLGYPRHELIGRLFLDFVDPECLARVPPRWEELRKGLLVHHERTYIRKDGSRVPVEVTARLIPPNWFVSIARDISERRRIEEDRKLQSALLDGQNRLLAMIASDEPLDRTLDEVARLIDAQPGGAIASILLMDATGRNLICKAAPSLPPGFAAAAANVPVGPDIGSCGTAAYLRAPIYVRDIAVDSRWAHYRKQALADGLRACWSTPVLSRTGEVLGTFALYYREPADPTPFHLSLIQLASRLVALAVERERAQQALIDSTAAMRNVVDHAPVAIMTIGLDRRVLTWNAASERILGWTAAEAIGKTIAELMVPSDKMEEHDRMWPRALSGEAFNGVRVRRQRKDGSRVDLAIWSAPLRAADGASNGMLAFVADVTGQTRLEDQLLRAQRMESIGRLAGGISHDFNNLLAVISGYSESMLRRTTPEHPLRDHAEEIQRAAARGASLTQQLLAFSRRQSATPRVIDLSAAVQSTYSMLRRVITDKIEIIVRAAERPVLARVDPGHVEQILVNLAINARDAMPGGGTLTVFTGTIQLGPANVHRLDAGLYACLTVADTGFGMDAQTCARIFEPFFTTKDGGGGTGLGLSIVYGIVQQAGGTIAVHSTQGAGSRFEILLPAADQAG